MKKIFCILILFYVSLSNLLAQNDIVNYKIDLKRSYIRWSAEKLTRTHYGRIYLDTSYISSINGKISDGFFQVDMNSIINSDIKDKKENQQLVKHLKSKDFFETNFYPYSSLKIIKAIPNAFAKNSDPNYTLVGELTIKGKMQIITFPAKIQYTGKTIRGKAVFSFDRTKYGIIFNSEKFFPKIGKFLIKDPVKLEIVINGIRAE